MKYVVKLTAEFEVEAENVAHAYRVARASIRSIGDRHGGSRTRHDRDFVSHSISRVSEALDKPRRITR